MDGYISQQNLSSVVDYQPQAPVILGLRCSWFSRRKEGEGLLIPCLWAFNLSLSSFKNSDSNRWRIMKRKIRAITESSITTIVNLNPTAWSSVCWFHCDCNSGALNFIFRFELGEGNAWVILCRRTWSWLNGCIVFVCCLLCFVKYYLVRIWMLGV